MGAKAVAEARRKAAARASFIVKAFFVLLQE
jgi:hypothetical protein